MSDICDRFQAEPYLDPIKRARYLHEFAAKPFFSDELPCEYCGHPVSECGCDNAPEDPICPALGVVIEAALKKTITVGELHKVFVAHRLVCQECGAPKKMPKRETGSAAQNERLQ